MGYVFLRKSEKILRSVFYCLLYFILLGLECAFPVFFYFILFLQILEKQA